MRKKLTKRQQELLDLLKSGLTPAEAGKKAKPPISPNAVYMAIRRIEAKGYKVKLKESPRGRRRKRPSKPGPKAKVAVVPSHELVAFIDAKLASDIKRVRGAMKENNEAKAQAEATIKRLAKENVALATLAERLEAAR